MKILKYPDSQFVFQYIHISCKYTFLQFINLSYYVYILFNIHLSYKDVACIDTYEDAYKDVSMKLSDLIEIR